jgi:diacylglycerol kinase
MLKGRLSKLRRHLRCRVVHEVAILAKDVAAGASLLLIWISSRVGSVALL